MIHRIKVDTAVKILTTSPLKFRAVTLDSFVTDDQPSKTNFASYSKPMNNTVPKDDYITTAVSSNYCHSI